MSYVSINAKISAMKGRMLSYNDYESLSKLKSVEEIGIKLKDFQGYHKAMEGLEELVIRRELIEQRLILSLAEDFWRIYLFTGNYSLRKYLDAFFLKNEVQIIKHLLALVCDERERGHPDQNLNYLKLRNFKIDISKLYSSANVTDFIDNLAGTPFYKPLANVYKEGTTLFQLEMQLDLFYYINLWNAQNKYLNKEDRLIMNRIVGTEIDLRNVMWIYRFKRYYQINSSLLYAYLIPINYRLKLSDINQMLEVRDIRDQNDLNEMLPRQFKSIFSEETTLEYDFHRAMQRILLKTGRNHPNSIAPLAQYMYSKELEINNITSLIEGVRYSLASADILQYLSFWEEKEVE